MNYLKELPFNFLSFRELLKETGAWIFQPANTLNDFSDLFGNVIDCPDNEFTQEDLNLHSIESKYYNVK